MADVLTNKKVAQTQQITPTNNTTTNQGKVGDVNSYYNQAQAQYDQAYNTKVQGYKNQLADNLLALDNQKTGINQAYDKQVADQNLTNTQNKNSISNAMIGRGLNNSSIAISGLAEQDAKNQRLIGDINTNRTNELSNIEAQKAQAKTNTNATLSQLEADRAEGIQSLAQQLEQKAWERDYQERQLNADTEYKNATLQWDKDKFGQQLAYDKEKDANELAYNYDTLAEQKRSNIANETYNNNYLDYQKENSANQLKYNYATLEEQKRSNMANEAYNNNYLGYLKDTEAKELAYKYAGLDLDWYTARNNVDYNNNYLQYLKDSSSNELAYKYASLNSGSSGSSGNSVNQAMANLMADGASDPYNAGKYYYNLYNGVAGYENVVATAKDMMNNYQKYASNQQKVQNNYSSIANGTYNKKKKIDLSGTNWKNGMTW